MSKAPKTTTIYTVEQVVVENGERTRRMLPGEPVYRDRATAEQRVDALNGDIRIYQYGAYVEPLQEINEERVRHRQEAAAWVDSGDFELAFKILLEHLVHEVEILSSQDWVERQIEEALEGRGKFVYFELGTLDLA